MNLYLLCPVLYAYNILNFSFKQFSNYAYKIYGLLEPRRSQRAKNKKLQNSGLTLELLEILVKCYKNILH